MDVAPLAFAVTGGEPETVGGEAAPVPSCPPSLRPQHRTVVPSHAQASYQPTANPVMFVRPVATSIGLAALSVCAVPRL